MTESANLHAQAVAAFNRHDWQRVGELTARLLSLVPDHAVAHYFAGIACMEQRQLAPALQHLRRATELDAAHAGFAAQLARALSFARLSQEALSAADRALVLSPQDPATLDLLGGIYAQNEAHAKAVSAFRRAVALMPAHAAFRFNLATSLIANGDIDDAEREIETCLALDPKFWKAHLTLAHLHRQTPSSHHVARLQSMLAHDHGNSLARICLNMALAKEYEDLADYPRAFGHLLRGKAASREGLDYSIEHDEALFAALARAFPEPLASASGHPSREPIFVFGLPRTGTTLVERIISSHPSVTAAGELQNFGVALRRAWNSHTPLWLDSEIAARTRDVNWQRVGADYISSTRPATGHTSHFVDKLPHNFLYAGFIASALPNARMICLRRDPMDACLSNFRQLFAERLPYYNYSFDLLDTGRYYVLFDRLMAHWQHVFPGRILEVRYEALIDDQESVSRQVLEFCGLPWNDACLHFEKNRAPVGTASALQVREPVYRSAIGRWKRYETQLAELRELLVRAGVDIPP
ncbi:sulfotransferase [Rhodanobacter sp. C01]|uniref:tetratricopeptide repeat-containing sulfotransferase family protein n=1 Tax=Rhodanobacter sp. C01 TaxID=1945856 RepID=UPI000985DECE|nr:sulfotransferase [Rhodanobacter sp. C01]OOG48471.1 sulfotransferase [Rhodanobacter sp. C01]